MQALVYHGRNDLRYESFPVSSQLGPNEVRLRVKYAAICHTDINELRNGPIYVAQTPHPRTGRSIPLVLGHEFSGQIIEAGKQVRRLKVDDRVAVNCVDACRNCFYCAQSKYALCPSAAYIGFSRDGGFSEWAIVPEDCCYRLSPGISYRAGALVEPLSVGLHAARQSRLDVGSRVAVIGGGAVGLCTVQALRAVGARQVYVVERAEAKKPLAMQLGATAFINPLQDDPRQAIEDFTDGGGADATFECVGSDAALETAVEVTRPGGTICLVGIYPGPSRFDFNSLMKGEKTLVTSLAYGDEFPTTIAMLADGRLQAEPLITRTLSWEEALEKGFHQYEAAAASNVRTLVQIDAA